MCNKQYDFIKDKYRQLNIYVNGYKKLQNSSHATEQNLNLFRLAYCSIFYLIENAVINKEIIRTNDNPTKIEGQYSKRRMLVSIYEMNKNEVKGIECLPIIQGLSFSYFAAWIFYMLSDVVPSAQRRLDSIKKLGTYYTAIDEALMTIEGVAFMKKGSVPKNYTSKDLSNSVIETIETPLASDSSRKSNINVPISSKLSLAFTLVTDSQIKSISRIIEDAISNTNQLLPHEVKQLLAIQSSKFISYFKNEQSILVIVNNRDEINNVFDDFIKLRSKVAKLKVYILSNRYCRMELKNKNHTL